MKALLRVDGTKVPLFLAAKNLEPYIDQQVKEQTKLIKHKNSAFWNKEREKNTNS